MNKSGYDKFTAKLTFQLRDVQTLSPKVLMTDILNEDGSEFRDHCWVTLNDELKNFLPRQGKKKNISFIAKTKVYFDLFKTEKKTLVDCKKVNLYRQKNNTDILAK